MATLASVVLVEVRQKGALEYHSSEPYTTPASEIICHAWTRKIHHKNRLQVAKWAKNNLMCRLNVILAGINCSIPFLHLLVKLLANLPVGILIAGLQFDIMNLVKIYMQDQRSKFG